MVLKALWCLLQRVIWVVIVAPLIQMGFMILNHRRLLVNYHRKMPQEGFMILELWMHQLFKCL